MVVAAVVIVIMIMTIMIDDTKVFLFRMWLSGIRFFCRATYLTMFYLSHY